MATKQLAYKIHPTPIYTGVILVGHGVVTGNKLKLFDILNKKDEYLKLDSGLCDIYMNWKKWFEYLLW